jgi:hypothetical protein
MNYRIGILTALLLLLITSCQQKELFLCPPMGDIPVNVIIHWDSVPTNIYNPISADKIVMPSRMSVYWYPSRSTLLTSNMGAYGGREFLDDDIYSTLTMDFNGNSNLAFRSNGTRADLEVYNIRMNSSYNSYVPQLPGGEYTVAEAYPYQWYIYCREQTADLRNANPNDTLTVHFYPQNALREFTFMIYDVQGAERMMRNSGAISGMAGSLYPAQNRLATPATILFNRVENIKNAQTSSRWTEDEKRLFAQKNPNWQSADTLVGWTRDWVTGRFVTFGALSRKEHIIRLAVEAVSKANNHYSGAWGWWNGTGENTVAAQIDSAMGARGTYAEQMAWRGRNGGYDIIIYNDHRLVIPENETQGENNGGFIVNVDDWGDMITVPVTSQAGAKVQSSRFNVQSSATPTLNFEHKTLNKSQRAPINTYATIPDFVVNGVWKEGGAWERVFNEQYVYKPESGLLWDYSPVKLWHPSGAIDFYAYAPAGVKNLRRGLHNNPAASPQTDAPTLEYSMRHTSDTKEPPFGTTEPAGLPVVDVQEDLLVAVNACSSPQNVAVLMNFHHAFSRITAKAKIDAQKYRSGVRVKVTRLDIRNLYTKGQLQLKPDSVSHTTGIPMKWNTAVGFNYGPGKTITLWTALDTLATYRFKLIAPMVSVEDEYTTLLRADDGIMVIPQHTAAGDSNGQALTARTTDAEIYVEYDVYSITTGVERYQTSLQQKFPLSATTFAFEIGRQYELQLTLDVP